MKESIKEFGITPSYWVSFPGFQCKVDRKMMDRKNIGHNTEKLNEASDDFGKNFK